MRFLVAFLCFALLAIFSRLLGKLWFSLVCGILFLGIAVYANLIGRNNIQFYCNKIEDKCSYLENSLYEKEFKEYNHFKLSNVIDVKYEEKIQTYYRKHIKRERLDKKIFFVMNDKTTKLYPASLTSSETMLNEKILSDIKGFLNSYKEEYVSATDKDETPNFSLWIIAFLSGCTIGFGIYRAFWRNEDGTYY